MGCFSKDATFVCASDNVIVNDRPRKHDVLWFAGIRHSPEAVTVMPVCHHSR